MSYWQGKKIRLRAIEPADADTIYAWNQDSERGRHLDFLWPPSSRAEVQAWVEAKALQKLEKDQFFWMIENNEGQLVGSIDTHDCSPKDGTFSYGVAIAAEQRGCGYALEAVRMVLRYYFAELRYQKATVSVDAENLSSIRLHEKLGFQLEGRHRRMFYTHGAYVDVLWYGLTKEEFEAMEMGKE